MSKRKTVLILIMALFVFLIIAGASYAYFAWNSSVNKNVIFNTAGNLKNYIVYDEGESKFVGDFNVSNNYNQGMHSTISLYKKQEAANVNLLATIHMDINQIGENMKKSSALKWVVTKGTSSNNQGILAQGNFIGSKNGDILTLVPNIEVTTTETFYTIWIWLDAAENPSDLLAGETLDTNVWTEINQLEGTEDRYEITRINANYQTISATVVDNKYKVTNYAVTTSNTTPSTWENITQANQSNVYNLTYTASETGTYYVWFKDSNNRTTSKSIQVTSVDNTSPTCTWGTFNPVQIGNNETSSITLTCTDTESELSINNLTTKSITKSNNNVTVTNVTKTSVTNGYKYTVTVKGTETDGTTTLTLPVNSVKNALGLGNAAVTSDSVTVANQYTVNYVSGNNNCTLNSTTYAAYTATYGQVFNIANPTCTGYTFTGWTANNTLDTTNAKYGTSSNAVTTAWSNASTKVTATYFKDLANRTSKTVTLTANWIDTNAPTVEDIGGGTTINNTSQKLTLKCNDNAGVTAYYWGTTEPTAANAITTTTSTDLTSLASNNGLSKTVSSEGTYWLACKDATGNFAKKSITIRKYTVNLLLEKINGTAGIYTSNNYEPIDIYNEQQVCEDEEGCISAAILIDNPQTYYIKDGTTLTFTQLSSKGYPYGSDITKLNGYSTTFTTNASILSTSNVTINNNTTTYYLWFNRNTYTVTITKPTNGSIKAETVTKTENSVTVTETASGNGSLIVKDGDTVKATATPNTGYSFNGWSGGYLSANTTNPSTGGAVSANKTITGSFTANTYTISYTLNNGTHSTSCATGANPTSVTYNTDVRICNPTRIGYTFSGWTSNSSAGLGSNAKTGTAANPSTAWTGSSTKNTYFRNLRDTLGTVTLTANWKMLPYKNIDTNTYYETLNDAFSGVDNNQTIQVLNNVTETTTAILSSKTGVKIDLNGKTITFNNSMISNQGTLDIYSSASGGTIKSTRIVISNRGTLTTNATSSINAISFINTSNITSVDSNTDNDNTVISNTDTVTLNENTSLSFNTANTESESRYLVRNSGTLTINGATLTNTISSNIYDTGINLSSANARFIMNYGTINTGGLAINNASSKQTTNPAVTISQTTGKSTTITSSSGKAIHNDNSGTINISGGTFSGGDHVITNNSTGIMNVSGGSATACSYGNCIRNNGSGTINITGGTWTGLSSSHAAVSNASSGSVTINGASVDISNTATYAAVMNLNAGILTIQNGTIEADSSSPGVYNYRSGTVVIEGGTISSTSGYAVKNGSSSSMTGTVNITGGSFTAGTHVIVNYGLGTINVSDISISCTAGNCIRNEGNGTITLTDSEFIGTSNVSNRKSTIYNYTGGQIDITRVTCSSAYSHCIYNNGSSSQAIINITDSNITSAVASSAVENAGSGIITIDGDDTTITNTGTESSSGFGVENSSTGTINILSGSISNAGTISTVVNASSGTIIIDGENVNITKTGTGYAVVNTNDSTGTITIKEGTISSKSTRAVYNANTGTINIEGGTISSTSDPAVFNGKDAVTIGTINISGGTFTAGEASVLNNGAGTVNISGGTFTSNGERSTIINNSSGYVLIDGEDVDIKNTAGYRAISNISNGIITIKDATIQSAGHTIWNGDVGTINIEGGTITNTANAANVVRNESNGIINITGGSLNSGNINNVVIASIGNGIINVSGDSTTITNTGSGGIAFNVSSSGTVNVYGGVWTAKENVFNACGSSGATLNIYGGTFIATGSTSPVVNVREDTNGPMAVNIYGGTFTSPYYTVYNQIAATVNISGGVFTTTGDYSAVRNRTTGVINVSGGTFTGYNAIYNQATGTINVSGTAHLVGRNDYGLSIQEGTGNVSGGYMTGPLYAIHISTGTLTMTGGTAYSQDGYAIYARLASTINIGSSSNPVSTISPKLITNSATNVAIHGYSGTSINWYDGVIYAPNTVYSDVTITSMPTGYSVKSVSDDTYTTGGYRYFLVENSYMADTIAPTISSVNATFSNDKINATVTASDNSGGSGLLGTYGWKLSSNSLCDDTVGGFIDTSNATNNFVVQTSGTYYVCVRVSDNAGNLAYKVSSAVSTNSSNVSVGDYISYTPTRISVKTNTSKTGYSNSQTINPSELNLWRVLNINSDGTIDIISEYVSSTSIYFRGVTGYKNYVGYLNELAKMYETPGITVGSRHFGYNGQTEYITDTSKFTPTAPWACSTGGACNPVESLGGGDTLYLDDYNLVNTALGTRNAYKPTGSSLADYWAASRYYMYNSSSLPYWLPRFITNNGTGDISQSSIINVVDGSLVESQFSSSLRPIVTLKTDLIYTGDGTSANPWQIQGSNAPVLDSGMIPVVITHNNIVTAISNTNSSWYDYGNKVWANAVLVKDNGVKTREQNSVPGTVIDESDILAYYVWIPRYSYKIWTLDASNDHTGEEQMIDIKFVNKSVKDTGSAVGEWYTPPAFTFGTEELSGFWVGKFETSTDTSSTCYMSPSIDNCNNSNQSPRIVPNVDSLRYQTIGNGFVTSLKFAGGTQSGSNVTFAGNTTYGLTSQSDSHMMKNSEWGAVAYLSHSKYGINAEIRKNDYRKDAAAYATLTGCGANVANANENAVVTTCAIPYGTISGEKNTYPQSTTGNISGIFDMSGGAWEYVMGNYNNTTNTFFSTLPSSKYYDVYSSSIFTGNYNTNMAFCTLATCGGQALYETRAWYDDYAYFVNSNTIWFGRGGIAGSGIRAGAFYCGHGDGDASYSHSWRSSLVVR